MHAERSISRLPERNPITHRAHRRQVFWQIFLPLSIGVIGILVLAIFAGLSTNPQASQWADVALIFLVIPVMVLLLLLLALNVGLIVLQGTIIRSLPTYTRQAQDIAYKLSHRARSVANAAVEPVLRIESFRARLRALRR